MLCDKGEFLLLLIMIHLMTFNFTSHLQYISKQANFTETIIASMSLSLTCYSSSYPISSRIIILSISDKWIINRLASIFRKTIWIACESLVNDSRFSLLLYAIAVTLATKYKSKLSKIPMKCIQKIPHFHFQKNSLFITFSMLQNQIFRSLRFSVRLVKDQQMYSNKSRYTSGHFWILCLIYRLLTKCIWSIE